MEGLKKKVHHRVQWGRPPRDAGSRGPCAGALKVSSGIIIILNEKEGGRGLDPCRKKVGEGRKLKKNLVPNRL